MASTHRTDRIDTRTRRVNWHKWPINSAGNPDKVDSEPLQLGNTSHLELEDEDRISWGLSQCDFSRGPNAKIHVLYGHEADLEWKFDIDDEELKDIMKEESCRKREKCVRICFINTLETNEGWLPGNFNIRASTIRILRKAGLSGLLLKNLYSSSGYWAKMGNQRFANSDDTGNLISFEVAYQYRCGWNTGVSYIQFIRTRSRRTYFCINYPSTALARLRACVKKDPGVIYRDFALDILAADDALEQWQVVIEERRMLLLSHERKYEDGAIDFDTATRQLHRLSRDWHTLSQDSMDSHAQLEFLRGSYTTYLRLLQSQNEDWDVDKRVNMCESFDVLLSQSDICTRWTTVYRDRTNVRINLLFHLANQREARTNTQIATSTAKVAELTQRDSASMITIAAVTMVFLPGTFICAILSTTFFEHRSDGLEVSSQWWILPATTIPLTAAVFGVWLAWRYFRLKRQETLMPMKIHSKLL